MGVRHRLILALLVGAASVACKRPPPPNEQAPPPVDHLAPGELAIGKDKAFALPLPRAARVVQRYGGSVHVTSALSPEEMSNFVRLHVKGGSVVAGSSQTRFDDVIAPDEPARHLAIDVRASRLVDGIRSEMEVRDVTAPAVDPSSTIEDRWKKAGLAPDGRILDPQHLQ